MFLSVSRMLLIQSPHQKMDRLSSSLEDTAWCDEIDHATNDGRKVDDDDADAGLDLAQWDYLTSTYDRTDFFQESEAHQAMGSASAAPTASHHIADSGTNAAFAASLTQTGQSGSNNEHSYSTEDLVEQYLREFNKQALPAEEFGANDPLSGYQACVPLERNFAPSFQQPPLNDASCGMDQLRQQSLSNEAIQQDAFVTTPRIAELMKSMNASSSKSSTTARGAASQTNVSEIGEAKRKAGSKSSSLPTFPPLSTNPQAVGDLPAPMITPLTAYNYFYRNERDTIVNGMKNAHDPLPMPDFDFTPRKMAELLHHHWHIDPFKKKRQHRKTHGIIEFTTLSKVIARRWKMLPEHGREFYREVANVDQNRYETYLATLRQGNNTSPATIATSATASSTATPEHPP